MNGPAESRSWEIAMWGTILALALAYRLYGLTGDMFYDPIIYAQNAYNILQGTFTLQTDSWYSHRLPVFLPLVPIYALFGVGTLSSRLWPLLASLVQLFVLAWIARRLWGKHAAMLATLLAALAPLDATSGTVLQPDVILACFLTAAAAFWILAMGHGEPRPRLPLLLSGLFFAMAVVTRENAAIFAVFYLASILWKRPSTRSLLWTALGGLVVLLPLLLAYAVLTGDPFYRWKIVTSAYGAPVMQEGSRFGFYPNLVFHVRYSSTGLFAPLFVLGLLWGLLRPTRSRVWLLLWGLPVLFYLQFGSMSLTHYIPILKRDRFLTAVTAPAALLTASMLLEWTSWLERKVKSWPGRRRMRWVHVAPLSLLLVVLAASSLLIVRNHRRDGTRTFQAFQAIVQTIHGRPDLPVLFDHWRTGHRVSYYLGFREGADFYRGGDDRRRMGRPGSFGSSRLGYLSWYPDSTQVPPAIIILDRHAMAQVRAATRTSDTYAPGEIPAYAYLPPRSWRLVAEHSTFQIYQN